MGNERGRGKPKPAYVYDADEADRPIPGSKHSAKTKPTVTQRHLKDPNDKRKSISDPGAQVYQAVMSGAKSGERVPEKEAKKERRKSLAHSSKSPSKDRTRPPSAHGNRVIHKINTSVGKDHPSQFGIPTPTATRAPIVSQPIPIRPRALTHAQTYPRPMSFHAAYSGAGYGTAPPLSSSAYYQQPLMPTPSYPPPSPSPSYLRYAATPEPQTSYIQPPPQVRRLSERFGSDPISRTSSAFAIRDPPVHQQIQDAYEDGYSSASEVPRRRNSIRVPSRTPVRTKAEVDYDREAMPPPAIRPGILRNRTTEYHTDTSVSDPPYRESRSTYRDDLPPRRPSAHRNSVSYDLPGESVRVETANTGHRRQSYYGQSASAGSGSGNGMSWEEQARKAQSYQEDVAGPTVPLTAEGLRRHQQRHAGSSRSTKSSGSRDESDYRKSATTRTTRSGSGPDDENVTIKVTGGQARINVGGARIDCAVGGEIEIKRAQKAIRNGSDRSNSEYGGPSDRRLSRADRLPGMSRMSSQSGHSYTRTTPQYGAPAGFF